MQHISVPLRTRTAVITTTLQFFVKTFTFGPGQPPRERRWATWSPSRTSHAGPMFRSRPCRARSTATTTSPRPCAPGTQHRRRTALQPAPCRPQPQQPAHPDHRRGAARPARRILLRTDARHRPGRARARPAPAGVQLPRPSGGAGRGAARDARARRRPAGDVALSSTTPASCATTCRRRLPTVLINTHLPESAIGVLSIDNYGGARAMVRHLVDARLPPHRLHRRSRRQLRRARAPARLSRRAGRAVAGCAALGAAGRIRRSLRPSAPGVRCWNRRSVPTRCSPPTT